MGGARVKADRPSSDPYRRGGEESEAGEVNGSPLVACGEAAELLEAIDVALDPVRCPKRSASWGWRSCGIGSTALTASAPMAARRVLASQALSARTAPPGLSIEQSLGLPAVATLAGGDEAKRATERIGEPVDPGGQSASEKPGARPWAPLSAGCRRVGSHDSRIDHQILTVAVACQRVELPLPDAGAAPAAKRRCRSSRGRSARACRTGARPNADPKAAVHEGPVVRCRPAWITSLARKEPGKARHCRSSSSYRFTPIKASAQKRKPPNHTSRAT